MSLGPMFKVGHRLMVASYAERKMEHVYWMGRSSRKQISLISNGLTWFRRGFDSYTQLPKVTGTCSLHEQLLA